MIPLHDDNPTKTTPVITWTLIGLCCLVFLWQISLPEPAAQAAVLDWGLIPGVVMAGGPLPDELATNAGWGAVLSSMFLHGGIAHLGGNMLYLWIFGNNIEDATGTSRFLIFYLLCGLGAALFQIADAPDAYIPMIGASGAISGVLGAYLVLWPRARILVAIPWLFHARYIQAAWVLGFWFVMQLFSAQAGGEGVAWWAHIGGFITGAILIVPFRRAGVPLWGRASRRGPWG